MKEFNNIIKEICQELEIKLTILSDDWMKVLEKNGKIKYIEGNRFSLNTQSIGNILDDKGLFYDLINYKNYPIIKHHVIFKDTTKEEILAFFSSNKEKIVLKGSVGACGKEVFLIDNKDELLQKINELFKTQYSVCLCPYYDILHEYRVIVLDNKVKLIYGKNRPVVVGDGKHNLKELALAFNETYFMDDSKCQFDKNYIPKINEEVMINFQFNLSKGTKSFLEIDPLLKEKLMTLAVSISKDLDIAFSSIDIIETTNHELLIMEANSGVTISKFINNHQDGYKMAYDVYKDAIIKMFEE